MNDFEVQTTRRLTALEIICDYLSKLDSPTTGAAATTATTGTMTVTMDTVVKTITPTGNCTFNASTGAAGQRCVFVVTTSGTSSYVLTFGTNFKTTGTLTTGTSSGKVFTVSFVWDGTKWCETARTVAM